MAKLSCTPIQIKTPSAAKGKSMGVKQPSAVKGKSGPKPTKGK